MFPQYVRRHEEIDGTKAYRIRLFTTNIFTGRKLHDPCSSIVRRVQSIIFLVFLKWIKGSVECAVVSRVFADLLFTIRTNQKDSNPQPLPASRTILERLEDLCSVANHFETELPGVPINNRIDNN